ncbi:MAG TPA: SRPBCC family protein [Acidimicrobiales bacterium]|jgi:uncharacterized protein YndB with AHSA1/START domain|nr:SRPBCC family protein [Acidimicrobiales bacterium]
MDGHLERIDDRWQLRFTRRLPHPPEKIWRALTEPEHLAAWFPTKIIGDRVAGASLRFEFPNNEGPAFDGKMVIFDPPSTLEMRWGDDVLRFDLRADGDHTVLTFVDTFDEHGRAARDAAGWHSCLDLLGYHLAGEDPPWQPEERWAEVHPGYVEEFGPEAATIGPPPSATDR